MQMTENKKAVPTKFTCGGRGNWKNMLWCKGDFKAVTNKYMRFAARCNLANGLIDEGEFNRIMKASRI